MSSRGKWGYFNRREGREDRQGQREEKEIKLSWWKKAEENILGQKTTKNYTYNSITRVHEET